MYCILGSKIDTIEKGLNWISEHAAVDLPKLPPNVLLLSDESMNEIAQPISAAAVGSGSGDDEGVVGSLIRHFENALKVERTFYAILLGLWLAFALIGLIIVIWYSGVGDKYHRWRGTTRSDGDEGRREYVGKEHPIYDQHTEEEKQFRGLTKSPLPAHQEGDHQSSFSNYGGTDRPNIPRKETFQSTLSNLVAPGQAFLKLTSPKRNSEDKTELIVGGGSSEKYNSYVDTNQQSEMETPPPLWVNKWYRAVDSARSLFPTKGQKHGESIRDQSGSHSHETTEKTNPSLDISDSRPSEKTPEWTMIDPLSIGRELDGDVGDRYPPPSTLSYPRRLSRAPTLKGPRTITNIFDDPARSDLDDHLHHDIDEPSRYRAYASDLDENIDEEDNRTTWTSSIPLTSTSTFDGVHHVHVESVDKVKTGTKALAEILETMKSRERGDGSEGPRDRGEREGERYWKGGKI